jgi:hypothetical protein
MKLVKLLFYGPGGALADALGTTNEHERGLLRMLVNSILWITVAAGLFMAAATLR